MAASRKTDTEVAMANRSNAVTETAVAEVDPRLARIEQYREVNSAAARQAFEAGHAALALQVAPPWTPIPGEILEGTVFAITAREHPEFGMYPIVGVKSNDGDLYAVHCLPTTLHEGMRAVRPQAGDPIIIVNMGDRLSGRREDTEYHLYAVSVPGKALAEFQW